MISNNKTNITGHMIVKNEDQWVWFAINSVLSSVDSLFIYDTGSTDKTVKIIKSIKSKKIKFENHRTSTRSAITKLREKQISHTKTKWFWVIDGDEIYPNKTTEEVLKATKKNYKTIAVRRYDLIGDVYHKQAETVGMYNLYGQKGHLVTRLFNTSKLEGLHLKGDYPNEGYFTSDNKSTRHINTKDAYITKNRLYHSMYLKRSSLNESKIFNRGKYRIETGIKIKDSLPEIFYKKRPKFIPDPLRKRSIGYEVLASLITPIKNLKRKIK
ncbi:glycosyltransferase [Patescibacteria group bacterium]